MNLKFVNILEVSHDIQERVREWRNKDRIRTQMLSQKVITEQEHRQWLAGLTSKTDQYYLVYVNTEAIGLAYLTELNCEERTGKWGFYIGEDEYLGQGYGHLMLDQLLKIFFEDMKYQTLITEVLSENKVARDIYQKFDFKELDRKILNADHEVITLTFDQTQWQEKYKVRA